jgi:hypothetical protein
MKGKLVSITTRGYEGQRNQFLDFLKGIGCIGVVFIHVKFPGQAGQIISIIAGFAVPIFYMIAGYYSFGCSESAIKKRIKKILKIFICGYLYFFAWNGLIQLMNGTLSEWIKTNYSIKALFKAIVFCTIDFAVPLWYLIAMIETYILWYFVVKYKKQYIFANLMPLICWFYIVLTSICETNDFDWFWKMNFVSRALSWFLVGYCVHENEKKIINKSRNFLVVIVAIIGCIIALIPTIFNTAINFTCVGIYFLSTSLFVIAIKNADAMIYNPIVYLGDKLSLNIYIFHVLISEVSHVGFKYILKIDTGSKLFLWTRPIITVVLTIMFSSLLYYGRLKILKKHRIHSA